MAQSPGPPTTGDIPLPTGYAWHRAALQLTERLGGFPGDCILVIAPPTNDPTAQLAARMPRMQWLQVESGPFGWEPEDAPGVQRLQAPLDAPPFEDETLDAVVAVLAVPLLDPDHHEDFIAAWSQTLAPFGKWLELVALTSSRDPRLRQAETALKQNGFTRVRSNRLDGGGGSATLAIVSAKKE